MRRSLIHYWRVHLAVIAAAVVTTAVIAGALVVGDSVRGSLEDLTRDRLGGIDDAVSSSRFFRSALASDLLEASENGAYATAAPVILLQGSATNPDSGARASGVQILGVDERFLSLYDDAASLREAIALDKPPASIALNDALASELNATTGDSVILSFPSSSAVHPEFLLGSREASDAARSVRRPVARIVPTRGVGRFGLRPHQSAPLNAYVPVGALQRALNQANNANLIALSRAPSTSGDNFKATFESVFRAGARLSDAGLTVRDGDRFFAVESDEFVIRDALAEAIHEAADAVSMPTRPILTYVANAIEANGRVTPYSTVAALDDGADGFPSFTLSDGSAAPPLNDDEIILNRWAANDLGVSTRESVKLSYFVVEDGGALVTREQVLTLRNVIEMDAAATDARLTPEIPGLGESSNLVDWDAPFPVELDRIRQKDEDYWDRYRAAPKAFVALETGQRLWRSRFGALTSVWIAAPPDMSVHEAAEAFKRELLRRMAPEQAGFAFHPVKETGLRAASGATDFGALFAGFSMFLIASAALLVGLLFRLGVEGRASEAGLLLAVGFPMRQVRRQFLAEGVVLSAIGATGGVFAAVGFAGLMMAGLRTLWVDAVGATELTLHWRASSAVVGWIISVGAVALSILWATKRLESVSARALTTGRAALDDLKRPKASRAVAWIGFIGGVGTLVVASIVEEATAAMFFIAGSLLLVGGVAQFSVWLRRGRPRVGFVGASAWRMGAASVSRQPSRSALSAALVACACFVIVAVGANRRPFALEDADEATSGTGGYELIAESAAPLRHDPNTREGRFELDIVDAAYDRVVPFRLVPGEDASCLNLYQPETPRLLGATDKFIKQGGFRFVETLKGAADGWSLLEKEIAPGVVPAIGDVNSVKWILHLGLGEELTMPNERGEEIRLRLVALLDTSVFQSDLIISEANLLRHFPSRSGYSVFLIEAGANDPTGIVRSLESDLRRYGFDATSTTERLARFRSVEETYLSTFQTLGGFGLLLGVVGLGVTLMRNALERRGELALLRAVGFRRSTLVWMALAENALLLAVGIAIGSLSALVAVVPSARAAWSELPWASLVVTLAVVFAVGVLSSGVAAVVAMRAPLLPALKDAG